MKTTKTNKTQNTNNTKKEMETKNNMKKENKITNIEKVENLLKTKKLHFRNNLDVVNNDNRKLFQVRNSTNKTNIYLTINEYEMIKELKIDSKKIDKHIYKEDGSKVKSPYIAINNINIDELEKCINKIMIIKNIK